MLSPATNNYLTIAVNQMTEAARAKAAQGRPLQPKASLPSAAAIEGDVVDPSDLPPRGSQVDIWV